MSRMKLFPLLLGLCCVCCGHAGRASAPTERSPQSRLALDGSFQHTKTMQRQATPEEIRAFFAAQKKTVLTFFGYSGAGYEDVAAMRAEATRVLDAADPATTVVNIGATAEGIGEVYEIAKRRGFRTTGIVSTQARDQHVALSPHVDEVFFVEDSSWGGFLPGGVELSPTSRAMVENSDVLVAIGGGDVVRDELTAARKLHKDVRFVPADMNHAAARAKAAKKGEPAPTDFEGSAARLFRER